MLMTPLQVHEFKGKGAIRVISGKENECTKRIYGVLYMYTYFAGAHTEGVCKTGLLVTLLTLFTVLMFRINGLIMVTWIVSHY